MRYLKEKNATILTLRSEGTPADSTSSSGLIINSAKSQHNSGDNPSLLLLLAIMKIAKQAKELASEAFTWTLDVYKNTRDRYMYKNNRQNIKKYITLKLIHTTFA